MMINISLHLGWPRDFLSIRPAVTVSLTRESGGLLRRISIYNIIRADHSIRAARGCHYIGFRGTLRLKVAMLRCQIWHCDRLRVLAGTKARRRRWWPHTLSHRVLGARDEIAFGDRPALVCEQMTHAHAHPYIQFSAIDVLVATTMFDTLIDL